MNSKCKDFRDKPRQARNPYALEQVVKHYPETHPWIAAYDKAGRWLTTIFKQLEARHLRILEIGSGGGQLAHAIADGLDAVRSRFLMRLVEPSALMRRKASLQHWVVRPGVRLCVHAYPGGHRPCMAAAYDIVIGVLSFHHLMDWSADVHRLIQHGPARQLFVSGIETGDAVLVGTGRGACRDPAARAFWKEYHSAIAQHGIELPPRPGPLAPWDDRPLDLLLLEHGFAPLVRKQWRVCKPLTYSQMLSWVEHGALTSLLAFGSGRERRVLAEHMRDWISQRGISVSRAWNYTAGVRLVVYKKNDTNHELDIRH